MRLDGWGLTRPDGWGSTGRPDGWDLMDHDGGLWMVLEMQMPRDHLVRFLIIFFCVILIDYLLLDYGWQPITNITDQNPVGEQDLRRWMGGALRHGTLSFYLLICLLIANLFYLILLDFSTYLSACLSQTYMDLMTLYFCLYLWSNLLSKNKWLRQT